MPALGGAATFTGFFAASGLEPALKRGALLLTRYFSRVNYHALLLTRYCERSGDVGFGDHVVIGILLLMNGW